MKLNILIIDDSASDLYDIKTIAENLFSRTKHIASIHALTELTTYTLKGNYDLAILDIDMPKQSGFDIAEKLHNRKPDTVVMFCTSHDEFVYQSFAYNVFYFIRKSHLQQDMINALQKYIKYLPDENDYYLLQEKEPLAYSHIMYFEVSGNQTYIYTDVKREDGNTIYYKENISLKKLAEKLPRNMFVQPSQTHLVHVSFIKEIRNKKIILLDGSCFDIVKDRLTQCESLYLQWVMR